MSASVDSSAEGLGWRPESHVRVPHFGQAISLTYRTQVSLSRLTALWHRTYVAGDQSAGRPRPSENQ